MKKKRSTSKPEPSWRISGNLVRIVLLRVLPGHETPVGREIERQCLEIGVPAEHFRVFRLFGSYDLAIIQDHCELTKSDLARLGTLDHITGSLEYVCYSWLRGDDSSEESFNLKRLSQPLLGLCFLKINPLLSQRHGLEPEIRCTEMLSLNDPSVQVLGTMGWAEMLLLIADDSLERILHRISSYFLN